MDTLFAAYIVVAMFFCFMTSRELRRNGRVDFLEVMPGLLACLFWPLVFVAIFIETRRQPA
jgi:hypothetical protein